MHALQLPQHKPQETTVTQVIDSNYSVPENRRLREPKIWSWSSWRLTTRRQSRCSSDSASSCLCERTSILGPLDENVRKAILTNKVSFAVGWRGRFAYVTRWFNYFEAAHPEIQADATAAQVEAKEKRAAASSAGGSCNIGLENTEGGVDSRLSHRPFCSVDLLASSSADL